MLVAVGGREIPARLRAEGPHRLALFVPRPQVGPGLLGAATAGRFGQAHPGQAAEDVVGLAERGQRAGQGGQRLRGGAVAAGAQAEFLIPGEVAAAVAAGVVGAVEGDGSGGGIEGAGGVGDELGVAAARRAGQAGA